MNACGVAVCEIYFEKRPLSKIKRLAVRLQEHVQIAVLPFRELRAFQIGKFITVQGTVLRVSAIQPFLRQAAFVCSKCLETMVVYFKDGIYQSPSKCTTNRCTSKHFSIDRESSRTIACNIQKVRLQEIMDPTDSAEEGRIPRILEAELTDDLVDSIIPGEIVCLSGILKTLDNNAIAGENTSALYLDVNSITKSSSVSSMLSRELELSSSSGTLMQQIQSLSQSKDLLPALVHAFCPHIYGNEMVKLGLLLGLFGGNNKRIDQLNGKTNSNNSNNSSSNFRVRSDPHVLIVGDPGLGKSQLLRFASTIAPRAVYVCANTSTAVGLTATVQDGGLEAGALVLSDQGCCCIDEFDKIGSDGWRSLLDVMEQQTVNVAKAGIVCTLPARASILAAANPINGHYNKNKTIVENVKMDAALLSRFDLIFVLLDKPNVDMDKMLSERVLGKFGNDPFKNANFFSQPNAANSTLLYDKISAKKNNLYIPSESLLRSYINVARQQCHPRMTEEASKVIQSYYMEMRSKRIPDETLPVTTRHLESMIRLTEARAKLELRHFVTEADAQDIVELFRFCTMDIIGKEDSLLKSNRRISKTATLKRFVSELIKISSRTGEIDFVTQQLQSLYEALALREPPFRELINALNEHGYLLCRSSGQYRLLVT